MKLATNFVMLSMCFGTIYCADKIPIPAIPLESFYSVERPSDDAKVTAQEIESLRKTLELLRKQESLLERAKDEYQVATKQEDCFIEVARGCMKASALIDPRDLYARIAIKKVAQQIVESHKMRRIKQSGTSKRKSAG